MKYTIVSVPHYNDSFSRLVIANKVWEIRFTYNHPTDCWKFGIYDSQHNPLYQDIKIVPGIPLNIPFCRSPYPLVLFAAKTKLDRIGYHDFWDGNAEFVFVELSNGIRQS